MTAQLDHLSASQINLFLDEPSLWLLRRFHDVRDEAGAGAWRGSALEAALDQVLLADATDEDAAAAAQLRFERDAQGEVDEKVDKEREALGAYLANLVPYARNSLPKPLARQVRIELRTGLSLPIIGFLDYSFDDFDMDLKSSTRMPSIDKETGRIKDKAAHLRQVAIYWAARGKEKPQKLLYATPGKQKEPLLYEPTIEELEAALRQVTAAARAMERLNAESDPMRACELYPPRDIDGFRWGPQSRAKAMEVWAL